MPTLPIAAVGVEEIIWVVILIFWGIAQMASKARKAKQPPRPYPGRRPTPHDQEIREMMEQLAGRSAHRPVVIKQEEEEDEEDDIFAAPYALPKPPPVQQKRPAPAPSIPVWQPPPSRRRLVPDQPIEPSPAFAAIADITDIADIAPMLTAEQHVAEQLRTQLGSGLSAAGLPLKIQGASLSGAASVPMLNLAQHHGAPLLNVRELRRSVPLKKAILAKIILDTPRALSPYSAHTQH
ncbi:MAG: hypothetical protein M5U15_04800 [Kiritimatiellae bacterium]|nr:hypothetical protein [Kiritimatiellia bacterium]